MVFNEENNLYSFHYLSLITLFSLFFGSFIYNSAIALYGMPPFLGGYFTVVSVFFIFIFSFFLIKKNHIIKRTLLILLFFIFWFLYINFNYILFPRLQSTELYLWGVAQVAANLVCFFMALYFDFNKKNNIYFFLLLCSIIFLIVFMNISNGRFDLRMQTGNDRVVTYQVFGLIITVLSFFTLSSIKKYWFKLIFFVLALAALYYNGARSEFIFFLLSSSLLIFLLSNIYLRIIFPIFIAFIAFVFDFGKYFNFLSDNRVSELIDVSQSTSFQARSILNEFTYAKIIEKPFTGEYGAYLEVYGVGGYAHNISSAWADFGIIGFLIFSVSSLYLFLSSVLRLMSNKYSVLNQNLFLFSLSLLVGYLFLKDYSYMFFGLTIGLYLNQSYRAGNF